MVSGLPVPVVAITDDEFQIRALSEGRIRVYEKMTDGMWYCNHELLEVVRRWLSDGHRDTFQAGVTGFDLDYKFEEWCAKRYQDLNMHVSPGVVARKGSYFSRGCRLGPCFADIGVYVGENSRIGAFASLGACAQIGNDCVIGSNVTLASIFDSGMSPTIIEDGVTIGANCSIGGVKIDAHSVIKPGVVIEPHTMIINEARPELEQSEFQGIVPAGSVVAMSVDMATGYFGPHIVGPV